MQAVPLWGRVLPARLQEDPCPGRSTVPTARGHLENVHPPGRALHAATVDTAGDHNNTEYGDAAGPKDCLPYATKMHLLFEPKAMDAWVTRRITTNDEGDYVDAQTGETLGAAEKADYEGYLHRLGERHRVGEQADRLVRIVDKHLPTVAAETEPTL